MFSKNILAVLATAATLAAAIPASLPEALPALAKRVTHNGEGTVYTQQGGTGSCGQKNPDSAIIAAISNYWQDGESPGPFCGRKVQVTNTGSNDGVGGAGNTVTATVEDTCPSCDENHIDFSVGAWDKLTNSAPFGTIDISW
ncbi:hypothetical protein MMC06_000560 [Schaereria dolodes]|nr:hypothetical protein [Schaereria dolodes]